MKIVKVFIILFAAIVCIWGGIIQFKAEIYLKSTQKNGVFNDRMRLRHTPVLIFFIKHKYYDKDYDEFAKYSRVPYKIKDLKEGYIFNAFYGTYFAYCFFDIESLKEYRG